ncbi:MAG: penicillin-binding protein 1B [Candidatus Competibacterales bacterium]|nr:penicillin-binding protein 1B [Candidatus Competibacterales bacterium]
MSAQRRRRRSEPREPVRRSPAGFGLLSLFLLILIGTAIVGALAVGAYMTRLDQTIQAKFSGKRWAVPARVYARPLQLFPGARLSAEQFATELELLPYRAGDGALRHPGTYHRTDTGYEIYTRDFAFWDGHEPARRVRLSFADGRLAAIDSLDGNADPPLMRLEPVEIAGIYPAHGEDRVLIRFRDLPPVLIDALIAVEDRSFYEHFGLDFKGILRALLANLRAGRTVQGGSTLTQQLVKNFFLTNERTLERKINEALMALLVEWRYDKQAILEAYANEIYLGQNGARAVHGFGLASRFYFDRTLNELDLHHVALLVGLIKAPSYYNPRRFPERAQERRALVLEQMVEQNLISAEDAAIAKQMPLDVTPDPPRSQARYPTFLDLVRRHLQQNYREEDLTSEGLKVFTTLDPQTQNDTEAALTEELPALERQAGLPQGTFETAAVVVDTQTGELRALVGGRDPRLEGFNRALDTQRPAGSLLKPAVYLTALESPLSYSLVTPIDDSPLVYRTGTGQRWEPKNYDKRHHGRVPLRDALARSYNVATARLGLELDVTRVVSTLQRLGLERDFEPYPSLLLGAVGIAPIDIARMYTTFASGGYRLPLRTITEVTAADGQPLPRLYSLRLEQVVEPGPAYLINRALQRVVEVGTARKVNNVLPEMGIAGKTGTTDDYRDSWFAGYSGNLLSVVWLGRDDNQSINLSGSSGALPLWLAIMQRLPLVPLELDQPDTIERVLVDPDSGLLADRQCDNAQWVPFIGGAYPDAWAPCSGAYYSQRGNYGGSDRSESMDSFFQRLLR